MTRPQLNLNAIRDNLDCIHSEAVGRNACTLKSMVHLLILHESARASSVTAAKLSQSQFCAPIDSSIG
jgi:hypothetical protein